MLHGWIDGWRPGAGRGRSAPSCWPSNARWPSSSTRIDITTFRTCGMWRRREALCLNGNAGTHLPYHGQAIRTSLHQCLPAYKISAWSCTARRGRKQGHIVPGLGHVSSKIAADGPGPHDQHTHASTRSKPHAPWNGSPRISASPPFDQTPHAGGCGRSAVCRPLHGRTCRLWHRSSAKRAALARATQAGAGRGCRDARLVASKSSGVAAPQPG